MKYTKIEYRVTRTSVGHWSEKPYWAGAWKVELLFYRVNIFGFVKCEKVHVATVPYTYSNTTETRREAHKIGKRCVEDAR